MAKSARRVPLPPRYYITIKQISPACAKLRAETNSGFLTFVHATASENRVVKSLSLRVKRPHVRGVPLRHLKVL